MSKTKNSLTGYGLSYDSDNAQKYNGNLFYHEGIVKPEWIDMNGHMNVAYYVKAFDLAIDIHWAELGITKEYIEKKGCSTFSVECHITYQNEMKVEEKYHISSQILAYDEKRIHVFQTMYKKNSEKTIATAEWMNLHVNLKTRKVSEWPKTVIQQLEKVCEMQPQITWPDEVGKKMKIKKPIYVLG